MIGHHWVTRAKNSAHCQQRSWCQFSCHRLPAASNIAVHQHLNAWWRNLQWTCPPPLQILQSWFCVYNRLLLLVDSVLVIVDAKWWQYWAACCWRVARQADRYYDSCALWLVRNPHWDGVSSIKAWILTSHGPTALGYQFSVELAALTVALNGRLLYCYQCGLHIWKWYPAAGFKVYDLGTLITEITMLCRR